ncbi:MAG: RnfABCDGE type electron transport complex subunit G [bacterium]
MQRKMPEYIKFPLVLTLVAVISAASLAGLYILTQPAKEAEAARGIESALKVVFPEASEFEVKEAKIDGRSFEYCVAKREGEEVGYVAVGSATGYSSVLRVMVGVDKDFVIKGVEVLYQNETPGLGDKIVEIKSKKTWRTVLAGESPDESALRPWFQLGFDGKQTPVEVDKDGGRIEAITGATISSRAVCDAVNRAIGNLKKALSS